MGDLMGHKKAGLGSHEQETKFDVTRAQLEYLFDVFSKGLKDDDIEHKYRPRDYYDTPDFDLYRQKMSLRVQYLQGKGRAAGGFEQTLKFELKKDFSAAADALLRKECKNMLAEHEPALSQVSDKEGAHKVKTLQDKPLKHYFTVAVERRYFTIDVGKGKHKSTVELAFDVGEIVLTSDQSRHPFTEIEIELKKGSPAAIDYIQEQILRLAPTARLQHQSKAEQGIELYRQSVKNTSFGSKLALAL